MWSTGHDSRYNGEGITEFDFFLGLKSMGAKFISEMIASFLCDENERLNRTIKNSASYINAAIMLLNLLYVESRRTCQG